MSIYVRLSPHTPIHTPNHFSGWERIASAIAREGAREDDVAMRERAVRSKYGISQSARGSEPAPERLRDHKFGSGN